MSLHTWVTSYLSLARASGLPPVAGLCRVQPPVGGAYQRSAACHQHTLVDCCRWPAHTGGLPQLTSAGWQPAVCHRHIPVAFCQFPVHSVGQLPVVGSCWQPTTCRWHVLAANRLWLACTSSLPSVASVGRWPTVFTSAHLWPVTCGQCTRGLPTVSGPCRRPDVCRQCALAACCLLPAFTDSMPPVTSAWQQPAVTRQHGRAACSLSAVSAGGLPPIAIVCWQLVACHQCMPVACSLLPSCAGGLSQLAGDGWCPEVCHQCFPKAAACLWCTLAPCHLSLGHADSHLLITGVCWWAPACQRVPQGLALCWRRMQFCCLWVACTGGLPLVAGAYQRLAACHHHALAASYLSAVHASGLLQLAGANWLPMVCH